MSMNPGDIFVNYSACQNVEDVLAASTTGVDQILQDIIASIQPLRASWQGSSNQAWAQVQQTWNTKTSDMHSILSQYAPTLSEMKGNYATTDNNLAMQWSSIG